MLGTFEKVLDSSDFLLLYVFVNVGCKLQGYILIFKLICRDFHHSPVFFGHQRIRPQTCAEKMCQQTFVVHVTLSSTCGFTPNTHGGLIVNYNQLKLSLRVFKKLKMVIS